MTLKNYELYTLCTLILSNPPHLIVELKLILTQNLNFEFQNVVMQINFFLHVFNNQMMPSRF
jgi:hypothetical protein